MLFVHLLINYVIFTLRNVKSFSNQNCEAEICLVLSKTRNIILNCFSRS